MPKLFAIIYINKCVSEILTGRRLKKWLCIGGFMLGSVLWSFSNPQEKNIVLEYNTVIKIEKGKHIEETSILIQINNKNSNWISDVEISYGEFEKLEILEASILNSDGQIIRKLKKKEIISRSDISDDTFYSNTFLKEFKMKWHEYPYIIKYVYRKKTNDFMFITDWYPVIFRNALVKNATLEVQIPKEYEVFIDQSESLKQITDTLEDHYSFRWKASYLNQLKSEPFGTNFIEKLPYVTIVPKKFQYGIVGYHDTWSSFGKWQSQIITGLDVLPQSEKIIVDGIVEGLSDKKQIIKNLYRYLQNNTRYINITINEGGLIPYPASYVCENKYGDCKALTIYMKALLKYVGIESLYTLVYAGDNPVSINKSFPSQQFNHVILSVPLEKDTIWLECTSNYFPFNYLGTFTQNRTGFMIDGSASKLINIPGLKSTSIYEKSQYDFNLNNEGNGTLMVSKILGGAEFEKYKYIEEATTKKYKENQIREKIPIKYTDLQNWNISQPDPNQAELVFDASLLVRDQFRIMGECIAISLFPIYSLPFKSENEREGSVRINYPINKSDTINLNLSFVNQYQVKLPSNINLTSKYGIYKVTYSLIKKGIRVTRNFQLFANRYPLEKYSKFYSFINSIEENHRNSVIVLNPN